MRLHLIFLTLMIFSGNVVAADRVTQYLSMMEATLNTTTLFYSRLSPEVAKKIKPVSMPSESKEVATCLVNKARSEDIISVFDESLELSNEFVEYIVDTPTLTLVTLEADPEFMKLQEKMASPKFEKLTQISQECGVVEMNMKLSASSGIMDAMKSLNLEDN